MNHIPLSSTHFQLPNQKGRYEGKVRDVYHFDHNRLAIVVTDRISAFDCILPEPIPYKGEMLNQIAAAFLKDTQDIVPNWLLEVPDPAISYGIACEPIPIEMVIRGHLCGHAWRVYQKGGRLLCGQEMKEGLKANQAFDIPLITPTTKAAKGHDEDISPEDILAQKIVSPEVYETLAHYTRTLFAHGQKVARERGLILADTKYEFGFFEGKIYLMDEIHTPDSSRYFYADGFEEKVAKGEAPQQLSKEFVREWLMEQGFQGKNGQKMPQMLASDVERIQNRYLQLYKEIMGKDFQFSDRSQLNERLQKALERAGK